MRAALVTKVSLRDSGWGGGEVTHAHVFTIEELWAELAKHSTGREEYRLLVVIPP